MLEQPTIRKSDSWKPQAEAYHYAFDKKAAYLPLRMGWGKSKVVVDLVVNKGHALTLILCPVSVLGVWRREFIRHAGRPVDVLVLDKGSCAEKAQVVKQRIASAKIDGGQLVVVVNYESAWQASLAATLLGVVWDLVTCDEAHRIKGAGTSVSKFCARLRMVAKHRLCLSGTPMPHSPLDLYGQYRFLDTTVFGTNYAVFHARYAICDQQFPSKVHHWIRQDELHDKFYSRAYKPNPDDGPTLPPIVHDERTFALPAQPAKLYRALKDEMVGEIESGSVVASNALVKLLRLQQITSGFVAMEANGEEFIEELHYEKERLLSDLLSDLADDEPVVVFCRFTRDLESVRRVVGKLGRRYGELSGQSNCLTEHAEMPKDVDVIGVQIQSGGVGIDLTRAAYAVYWSIGFSLGDYEQSLARLHRPGQTRPVRIFHLIAQGTVDRLVYRALSLRKEVVESVLSGIVKRGSLDELERQALEVFENAA